MASMYSIVQKTFSGLFCVLLIAYLVLPAFATEVLDIEIDPPSPAYGQPFKCTLTLDQDDHRNACDLLPPGAAVNDRPWDICRIDHISNDKLTRYYNCIANKSRGVPGPGQYQIVVWNFTGDGETGQVTARRSITILASLPPTPTKTPTPTVPSYITPTVITYPTPIPTQYILPTAAPINAPPQPPAGMQNTAPITPEPNTNHNLSDLTQKLFDSIGNSVSSSINLSVLRTRAAVLGPLWTIIKRFLAETRF